MSSAKVKMEEDEGVTVQTEDEPIYVLAEDEISPDSPWTDLLFDYWFLWLIIAVGAIYLYRRHLAPEIDRLMREREDRDMEARLHKNPDLLKAREEAMQRARQKMQNQHDIKAAKKAEERRIREEKKREEMLNKNATKYRQAGYTLDSSVSNRKESEDRTAHSSRSDYNPLMGSGPGGGYRPPRRSCPGGGCG